MSTHVRIKFVPGLDRILGKDHNVQDVERARAEQAADIARRTAPRRTGAYRDAIAVEEDGDTILLVARDFKAHWIEWGSSHNRAYATLTNAADEVSKRIRIE